MKRHLFLLVILLMLSAACRAGSPATPAPADTAAPNPATAMDLPVTQTSLPLSTETPQPAISSPTHTSDAPKTQTPLAVTLTERELDFNGPWLLLQSAQGLYAVNADGSGLTLLTDETHIDLEYALSPDREHLAYVTMMIPGDYSTLELFLFNLPRQELERVTALSPRSITSVTGPDHQGFEALRAVYDFSPPVWSPSGNHVAFMGAQDGPSSDLYMYTLNPAQIDRLTDGPSEGYGPSWSPDGNWIVHFGVDTFGTGAGYSMRGAWAASSDGREVATLYQPVNTSAETLVGWVGPQSFMVYSWDPICGPKNLRSVNAATKAVEPVWPFYFDDSSLAFDPLSGSAVLSSVPGCDGTAEGLHLVQLDGTAQQLTQISGYATWSPEAGVFILRTEETITAFSPAGQEVDLAPNLGMVAPEASPGAARWAWAVTDRTGEAGMYISDSSESSQKIFAGEATWAIWSLDGQSVFFGDSSGKLFVAGAPMFIPILVGDGIEIHQDPVWAGNESLP